MARQTLAFAIGQKNVFARLGVLFKPTTIPATNQGLSVYQDSDYSEPRDPPKETARDGLWGHSLIP